MIGYRSDGGQTKLIDQILPRESDIVTAVSVCAVCPFSPPVISGSALIGQ